MPINHYFEVFSNDGSTTLFTTTNTVDGSTIITVTETGLTIGTETYTYTGTKKFVGVSFSENSTSPELAIGESFDGNAAYVYIVEAEPTINGVTVEYDGSVVATIPNGYKATLPIADKEMKTDIVITVPEAAGSAIPIEVATEAEMTALLESGEVGGVYKYTGTTGTYENGALYVLEEAEDELAGTWVFNDVLDFTNFKPFDVYFFPPKRSDTPNTYDKITNYSFDDEPPEEALLYNIEGTVGSRVLVYDNNKWEDETYKTITITSKLSEVTNGADLLAWLKANATKQ